MDQDDKKLPPETLCDHCREPLGTHIELEARGRVLGKEVESVLICAPSVFKQYVKEFGGGL